MAKVNFLRKHPSQQWIPLSSSSFQVDYPYCEDSSYDFGLGNLCLDNFAIHQDKIWPIDFASNDKISKAKSLSSITEIFTNKVSEQNIENDLNFLNLLDKVNVNNSINNAKPLCVNDLEDKSYISSYKKDKEYKKHDLSPIESSHKTVDKGLSKPKNGLNLDIDVHLLDLLDTVNVDYYDKKDPDDNLFSENSEIVSLSDLANQHFENLSSNETTKYLKEDINSLENEEYSTNSASNDNLNDELLAFLPISCDSNSEIKPNNKFLENTNKSDCTNKDHSENLKIDDFLNLLSLNENTLHEKELKSDNLNQINDFIDQIDSAKVNCGDIIEDNSADSSDTTNDFEPPLDLSACIKHKPLPNINFDEIPYNSVKNKSLEAPESANFNCVGQDHPSNKIRKNKKPSLFFAALSSKPKINTFLQQKVLDVQSSMLKNWSNSLSTTKPLTWNLAKPSHESIFANYKCRFLFGPSNCIAQ